MLYEVITKELGKEYIEPDEPAVIAEMVKEMEAQVDRVYKDRKMLRQVHTKSHGCVKGIFEVPELENDLKVGVFEHSRKFHAWIRFSNSNSTPKPDKVKDIRGVITSYSIHYTKLYDQRPRPRGTA